MPEVQRFHFHTMRGLRSGASVAYRLATFRPPTDAKILGATLGLLTNSFFDHSQGVVELYIAVTYNRRRPSRARNWVQFKRDFLFYAQRDVYREPTSPSDLTRTEWLPPGQFFPAGQERPVNVYVGALNTNPWDTVYDAFGVIYYVQD